MTRRIVTDSERFGDEPFIEGTAIRVTDIQAYWRQPGVGAQEMRNRFPELSEGELGAAVIYVEAREPEFEFLAEDEEQPPTHHWLHSTSPGWQLGSYIYRDGKQVPGPDTWEETYDRILMYLEDCGANRLVWRNAKTGAVVDLEALRSSLK